ncbi:hypothetical protein [Paenibacillus sp. OV219]|uniref:hypothetical protein n=1 Tax=Paenibacillus sp. OV219 TaxID=1884377 RepID=UPI0008D14706|nr:hypothetical protein [Paenibacillus sp. OV219]SEO38206.1 hypothetical protein SAMN05518847_107249 [Paenibacillus sp. OV219]
MAELTREVQSLVNQLHLSDQEIAEKFQFTQFGKQLTLDESVRFISFLKQELLATAEA